MTFEIGKTYQHNSGKIMTIIGRLKTHMYGECLIGEQDTGELVPVGESEDNAVNWHEIESNIQKSDTEKLKKCIAYEDGCEEWAGCPCVYYRARKARRKNDKT